MHNTKSYLVEYSIYDNPLLPDIQQNQPRDPVSDPLIVPMPIPKRNKDVVVKFTTTVAPFNSSAPKTRESAQDNSPGPGTSEASQDNTIWRNRK